MPTLETVFAKEWWHMGLQVQQREERNQVNIKLPEKLLCFTLVESLSSWRSAGDVELADDAALFNGGIQRAGLVGGLVGRHLEVGMVKERRVKSFVTLNSGE